MVFTLIDFNGSILAQTDPNNPVPLPPTATRFFDVPESLIGVWPGRVGEPAPVVAVIRLVGPNEQGQLSLTASVEVFDSGGNSVVGDFDFRSFGAFQLANLSAGEKLDQEAPRERRSSWQWPAPKVAFAYRICAYSYIRGAT